jgi:hypothetical protein
MFTDNWGNETNLAGTKRVGMGRGENVAEESKCSQMGMEMNIE